MRISLNTFKWYDPAWAAFIFFTRLPLWRIHEPPRECYRSVVEFWPLVGWLTGGIMAAVIYFGSFIMPHAITVLLAIAARILVTGALHEDGLADFFDGFGGGGNNRQRILDIMKDFAHRHLRRYRTGVVHAHPVFLIIVNAGQIGGSYDIGGRPVLQDGIGADNLHDALRTDGRRSQGARGVPQDKPEGGYRPVHTGYIAARISHLRRRREDTLGFAHLRPMPCYVLSVSHDMA